ncbi:MAG: hypothetical protein KGV50_01060 [Gammaproteobacteria bacterium]|nr:hypothetical protein [Gammaproteobacteria bacterium]
MNNQTYTKEYTINIAQLDFSQHLSLSALLGMLQDMASLHAEKLGHGFHDSKSKNEFWVFSQQSVRIHTMPVWNDVLTIETSVCDVGSLTGIREFSLSVNGNHIGEAAMQCMLLDRTTHRPKRLKNLADSLNERESQHPDLRPEKIKISDDFTQRGNHNVKISDLDLNQHVNNTKYAQWMLDTLPLTFHIEHTLQRYDVNFLAETFFDDNVIITSNYDQQDFNHNSSKPQVITFSGECAKDNKRLFSAKFYFL